MLTIFISHVFTAAAPNVSALNKPSTALRILADLNTEPFYVNLLLSNNIFLHQELAFWSAIYGCKSNDTLSTVAKDQFQSFIGAFSNMVKKLDILDKEKVDFKLKTQDEIETHYENVFLNGENPSTSADNSIIMKFVYYNQLNKNIYIDFEPKSKSKTLMCINALQECFK
ncbi:hypothetical protein EHP00_1024 [Ecytonucleospora hepatopenaei]|uniref:Uncharacterized protein n=1 Tax=Ecytonucleospora hepatopenaei TaxID=646526 RepID=A0A1W0E544_9MICR|nr:hypothetical protein EHP00_1024 [Ecytonucleospora hepatopenaei]